jgi:hypothetical protein
MRDRDRRRSETKETLRFGRCTFETAVAGAAACAVGRFETVGSLTARTVAIGT